MKLLYHADVLVSCSHNCYAPHVVQGTEGSTMAPGILRRVKLQLCSRKGDKEVPHTKSTCCHHAIVAWRLCV